MVTLTAILNSTFKYSFFFFKETQNLLIGFNSELWTGLSMTSPQIYGSYIFTIFDLLEVINLIKFKSLFIFLHEAEFVCAFIVVSIKPNHDRNFSKFQLLYFGFLTLLRALFRYCEKQQFFTDWRRRIFIFTRRVLVEIFWILYNFSYK